MRRRVHRNQIENLFQNRPLNLFQRPLGDLQQTRPSFLPGNPAVSVGAQRAGLVAAIAPRDVRQPMQPGQAHAQPFSQGAFGGDFRQAQPAQRRQRPFNLRQTQGDARPAQRPRQALVRGHECYQRVKFRRLSECRQYARWKFCDGDAVRRGGAICGIPRRLCGPGAFEQPLPPANR